MKGLLILLELAFLLPAFAVTFLLFYFLKTSTSKKIVDFILKFYLHWLISLLTWVSLYIILTW